MNATYAIKYFKKKNKTMSILIFEGKWQVSGAIYNTPKSAYAILLLLIIEAVNVESHNSTYMRLRLVKEQGD